MNTVVKSYFISFDSRTQIIISLKSSCELLTWQPDNGTHNPLLKATARCGDLDCGYRDTSQSLSLIICQVVHGWQRNVERIGARMIHGCYIEATAYALRVSIRELPTSATGGRVPACDRVGGTDIREVGKRAESGIAKCLQAIGTVGTCDGVQRGGAIIIPSVVGDGDGG